MHGRIQRERLVGMHAVAGQIGRSDFSHIGQQIAVQRPLIAIEARAVQQDEKRIFGHV